MRAPGVPAPAARRAGPLLAGLALAAGFVALWGGSALGSLGVDAGVNLAPWDAELQRRAALAALGKGDEAGARRLALRSLQAMPFNQSSLTIVALNTSGARAVNSTNIAAGLGWRDPLTNGRLVAAAVNEGAPDIAAQRIDAIGRISEDGRRTGIMADRLLLMPGGIEALAVRSAHHLGRGWIPDWLATPPASPQVAAARLSFIRLLESDDGTWSRQVIGQAMAGFTKAGDPAMAYAAWRGSVKRADMFGGQIYDPRFVAMPDDFPVGGEWLRASEQLIGVTPVSGGGLRLDAMAGASGRVISQMVRYGTGRHEIVTELSGDEPLVQSLRWTVQCVPGGNVPVTRTLTRTAAGWQDRHVFDVPQGCDVGYVALVATVRVNQDSTATVNSVALNPAGPAR